ncbi:hypothetical protein ACFL34_03080 [Candidatus Sumerlaeota bacterium]
MMKCPECFESLFDGAGACPGCGCVIEDAADDEADRDHPLERPASEGEVDAWVKHWRDQFESRLVIVPAHALERGRRWPPTATGPRRGPTVRPGRVALPREFAPFGDD